MQVEKRQHDEHRGEPGAVHEEQLRRLTRAHRGRARVENPCVQELQRVYVHQHDEQEHKIQNDDPGVLEVVPAEVGVLGVPDEGEQTKGGRKCGDARKAGQKVVESLRYGQRNDQEGDGESEYGIAEPLEAGNIAPPADRPEILGLTNGCDALSGPRCQGRSAPPAERLTPDCP